MTLAPLLPLWVAIPLVTAVLMVFAQPLALRRVIYLAVPSLSVIGAFVLLYQHRNHAVIAEQVGGFARGIGISFASDAFSALMLAATGILIIASAWFAISIGEDEHNRFFPTLTLVLMAGVNGAILTADLFNLFVWIEVMLMPSYALLAITGTWRRIGVDRMFVVVNLLTSSVFLLGVIYIYGAVGEVNIAVLAGSAANEPQVGIAITVCLIALCVKAGVVPVHGWLPRAYPATSAAVMGLFSGLHTKVAIYAIYRIVSTIFIFDTRGQWIIVVVLCFTMLVGSFGSLGEQRIRGSLAFQMVCGVGYILIALALAANTSDIEARAVALGAGIFYLIHHMLTMGSLILTSGGRRNLWFWPLRSPRWFAAPRTPRRRHYGGRYVELGGLPTLLRRTGQGGYCAVRRNRRRGTGVDRHRRHHHLLPRFPTLHDVPVEGCLLGPTDGHVSAHRGGEISAGGGRPRHQ